MHPLPFTFKRIHHRLLAFARPFAKFFATTPARYDMLVRIDDYRGIFQAWLSIELGVTRATVSRMLIALERLGLVKRTWRIESDYFGRRSKWVTLTDEGRRLVDAVRSSLAFPWFQTAFEQHFMTARTIKRRGHAQAAVNKFSKTLEGFASGMLDETSHTTQMSRLDKSLRVHWTSITDPVAPDDLTRVYSIDRRTPWPPNAWPAAA
jgi:DNA-binding MarR family transcriptional regulator